MDPYGGRDEARPDSEPQLLNPEQLDQLRQAFRE